MRNGATAVTVIAVVVGALVGVATELFVEAIVAVQALWSGGSDESNFLDHVVLLPWWQVVLAPTVGGLIVGVMLLWLPERRYQGISDVMQACATRGGRMDQRSGFVAVVAATVSLGSGASLGREGPAVHFGASLSAWVADRLRLSDEHALILLGSGAAAAVAASFDAPMAGTLFAMEVVVGFYAVRVFVPVAFAAVASMLVQHSVMGTAPQFALPEYTLHRPEDLPLFAVLGAVCALVVWAVIGAVMSVQWFWRQVRVPIWGRPALAGAVIGSIGLWFPQVLGVGYQGTVEILELSYPTLFLCGVLLAKVVAMGLALGSGFCGGVFGPALLLGAGVGSLLAVAVQALGWDLPGGAMAMAGMAAAAAAMLGAPISTTVIAFELTHNYAAMVPVMAAVAAASLLMSMTKHPSFFRWQLAQRSVDIDHGRNQTLWRVSSIDSAVSPLVPWAQECSPGQHEDCLTHAWVAYSQGDGAIHCFSRGEDETVPTQAIEHDTSVYGALHALELSQALALLVTDGGRPSGVLRRDRLWREAARLVGDARVRETGVN